MLLSSFYQFGQEDEGFYWWMVYEIIMQATFANFCPGFKAFETDIHPEKNPTLPVGMSFFYHFIWYPQNSWKRVTSQETFNFYSFQSSYRSPSCTSPWCACWSNMASGDLSVFFWYGRCSFILGSIQYTHLIFNMIWYTCDFTLTSEIY